MQNSAINLLSAYTLLIRMELKETNTELAIATGFVYKFNNSYFLITNGHCVTRVNPENKTRISNKIGFPTIVAANIRYAEYDEHTGAVKYIDMRDTRAEINLYEDEEFQKPTWFIHPDLGYEVDVIAIPLRYEGIVPGFMKNLSLNTFAGFPKVEQQEQPLRVADEVYILGYPMGVTNVVEFPIWKRGSVASEPGVPYKEKPAILVDTATRAGMSGSPVLLLKRGMPNTHVFGVSYNYQGDFIQFVGVYSGRIGSEVGTGDAQLGIVWKKEVIEQIIIGGKKGTIEFQNI